ncbi:MAG: hypothetical protein J3K34DRAFT_402509 [Monoraphidium minutum]|nr:MAG: hypothetical protein J3K34DRAFT_402509 [Monoraphidium minutum]
MCFSPPISIAVGSISWAMAAWLTMRKEGICLGRRSLMFWYFGLIEFLQVAQYAVADQCDNSVNKALTYMAYMHVAFQPLVVNHYFWSGFKGSRPELVKFILRLSLVGGVMMLFRLPGMPLGYLGDLLHKYIPDLPPSSMHGQACHFMEASCSPKLCSVTGGAWGHISWAVPLLPSTYLIPGASMHATLFFLPTLLMAGGVRYWLMMACVVFGPLLSMFVSRGDAGTYALEWPTIWCFFAAIQVIVAAICEFAAPDAFAEPPGTKALESAAGAKAPISLTADASAKAKAQ